jgi:hypothetical protein
MIPPRRDYPERSEGYKNLKTGEVILKTVKG